MTIHEVLHSSRPRLPADARIVYAAEVGSRAMGAETPSSDHDVIAILVSPPRRYLGIRVPEPTHPTIQMPGASLTAFDIRHAVDRIRRGNVRFLLASLSLAVHVDEAGLGERLRDLGRLAFIPGRAAKQFASMTQEATLALPGRGNTPRALLHVLHPALCARAALDHETLPLPSLRDLSRTIDGEASDLVDRLLRAKTDEPDLPVDRAIVDAVMAFGNDAAKRAFKAEVASDGRVSDAMDLASAIACDAIEANDRRERYGMGLMIGEMGEALAVLGNALRFGMDTPSGHGEVKPGERERLVEEMGDVAAAARWSAEAGIFDAAAVLARESAKFEKLVDPSKRDNLGRRLAPRLPGRE